MNDHVTKRSEERDVATGLNGVGGRYPWMVFLGFYFSMFKLAGHNYSISMSDSAQEASLKTDHLLHSLRISFHPETMRIVQNL